MQRTVQRTLRHCPSFCYWVFSLQRPCRFLIEITRVTIKSQLICTILDVRFFVAMVFIGNFNARNVQSNSQFCHVNQRKSKGSKYSKTFAYLLKCYVNELFQLRLKGHQIVQQYARWVLLGWALTFRLICKPLKRVFPDLLSLENAGMYNFNQ